MWQLVLGALYAISVNSDSYDQDYTFRALYYAYGAYCDGSDISSWDCKWCEYISDFQVSNNGDGVVTGDELQAFIGFDSDYDRIVLSFRGTVETDFSDWIDDLDIVLESYQYGPSSGEIHQGFYDSYNELMSEGLQYQMESTFSTYPGKEILITGHSLGAALAYVAAIELMTNSNTWSSYNIGEINTITFGSPRWCNQVLASYFDEHVNSNWRITNEDDIVPTMPYESFGFYHTATEIHYTSDSPLSYEQCDGSGEDSNCAYLGYSIDDHLNYLNVAEGCSDDSSSSWDLFIDEDDLVNISFITSEIDMVTTSESIEERIIYRWKQGLDNVSKVLLSVFLAIGWLMAFICCCCYCKTKKHLKQALERNSYVQIHEV